MFVITGATGNIGKGIALKLLSNGQKVRVIGRDGAKLKAFSDRGAEAHVGSADDVEFLKKAFAGAIGVFTMNPPDVGTPDLAAYQDRFSDAYAAAISHSKIKHVLNLSSIGGELQEGTGPIAGLHRQEEKLNKLGINVLHLRPAFFMENFLFNIPLIKGMGINGSSLKADFPMPMIATRDIAEFGGDALLQLKFSGNSVRYLMGPRDVTSAEATKILGSSIGKPDLPYVQFSFEDAEKGMMSAGISQSVAYEYNVMNRAFNEGRVPLPPRTKENSTPTTLEDFAPIFAAVYRA